VGLLISGGVGLLVAHLLGIMYLAFLAALGHVAPESLPQIITHMSLYPALFDVALMGVLIALTRWLRLALWWLL
jgi:hypothetical protein